MEWITGLVSALLADAQLWEVVVTILSGWAFKVYRARAQRDGQLVDAQIIAQRIATIRGVLENGVRIGIEAGLDDRDLTDFARDYAASKVKDTVRAAMGRDISTLDDMAVAATGKVMLEQFGPVLANFAKEG